VEHVFGYGPLPENPTVPISVFRHPLLQQFMLNIFCKLPVLPLQRLAHMKQHFLLRLMLSVFQVRAATPVRAWWWLSMMPA
jgi:hypothetical protein